MAPSAQISPSFPENWAKEHRPTKSPYKGWVPSTQSHGAAGRLTTQESTSLVPKLLAPTLDLAGPGWGGCVESRRDMSVGPETAPPARSRGPRRRAGVVLPHPHP